MMGLRGESMDPMTFGNMTHPNVYVLDGPIISLDLSHLCATEVFFGIWNCDFKEQKISKKKKKFNKIWHSVFSQMIQKSLQWPLLSFEE